MLTKSIQQKHQECTQRDTSKQESKFIGKCFKKPCPPVVPVTCSSRIERPMTHCDDDEDDDGGKLGGKRGEGRGNRFMSNFIGIHLSYLYQRSEGPVGPRPRSPPMRQNFIYYTFRPVSFFIPRCPIFHGEKKKNGCVVPKMTTIPFPIIIVSSSLPSLFLSFLSILRLRLSITLGEMRRKKKGKERV